jgi:hypothetical protein
LLHCIAKPVPDTVHVLPPELLLELLPPLLEPLEPPLEPPLLVLEPLEPPLLDAAIAGAAVNADRKSPKNKKVIYFAINSSHGQVCVKSMISKKG